MFRFVGEIFGTAVPSFFCLAPKETKNAPLMCRNFSRFRHGSWRPFFAQQRDWVNFILTHSLVFVVCLAEQGEEVLNKKCVNEFGVTLNRNTNEMLFHKQARSQLLWFLQRWGDVHVFAVGCIGLSLCEYRGALCSERVEGCGTEVSKSRIYLVLDGMSHRGSAKSLIILP